MVTGQRPLSVLLSRGLRSSAGSDWESLNPNSPPEAAVIYLQTGHVLISLQTGTS